MGKKIVIFPKSDNASTRAFATSTRTRELHVTSMLDCLVRQSKIIVFFIYFKYRVNVMGYLGAIGWELNENFLKPKNYKNIILPGILVDNVSSIVRMFHRCRNSS